PRVEGGLDGSSRVDKNGRVVMANLGVVALVGYEIRERVLRLTAATDIFVYSTAYSNSISAFEVGGTSSRCDTRWKRSDGTNITVRLAGRQLCDERGNPLGFEVFVEDITERRLLQKQIGRAHV